MSWVDGGGPRHKRNPWQETTQPRNKKQMEEKQNNSGGRNRSRAAVEPVNTAGAGEGEQPEVYYELSAEKRREVALLCREYT